MGGAEAVAALHADDETQRQGVLTGAAQASVGTIWSGDGAAFSDEVFKSGAPELESSMGRSGREANQVRHDQNGEAEVALPDVDRPEPAPAAVATDQFGIRGLMDIFLAGRPMGRAMPASCGDMGGGGGADDVADGVADGGMLCPGEARATNKH